MGISMAPLRLSAQRRTAVQAQGGGGPAILSTGPRAPCPGPRGLTASSRWN